MELKSQVVKEFERTSFAMSELTVNTGGEDLYTLVRSYFDDALHFYNKGALLEAFELFSYVWGLLDAGARLGLFNPGKAIKHFKVDQGVVRRTKEHVMRRKIDQSV